MSLRNRLLALSLLTLLLPWSGWKLLQELELFLREAQETALTHGARTVAQSLPFEAQGRLLFTPQHYLVLRALERSPELDGSADDWPDPGQAYRWQAPGGPEYAVLAGRAERGSFLFVSAGVPPGAGLGALPGLNLTVRSPRGLQRFAIRPDAPGPLQLRSEGGPGQAEGFLLDVSGGYRLELVLPALVRDTEIRIESSGGTADAWNATPWIPVVSRWDDPAGLMRAAAPAGGRAWLVDRNGWVLADSGTAEAELPQAGQRTTWLQRLWYRLVAGGRTQVESAREVDVSRLNGEAVRLALEGEVGSRWSQDPDTAVVSNTVAAPVQIQGKTVGAIVLQSTSDGLLLVTNRALGRLLLTTLVLTFGLAGGLWWFATRLSQRVRRLSETVSVAMEHGIGSGVLPLTSDRDELGELARNNESLLRAVADYNQYLQTLAGKLSHELKTPLAITRSSLENLSARPLDEQGRQFLERAQEGLERQAAIVRAMSEASRLEAAIRVAEWERTDLAELLRHCAAGYRDVHPDRRIDLVVPDSPQVAWCAPELLAQALDKLVDNAVTLTAPRERIELRLARVDGEHRIAVRNTGSRLPRELQDRLFDSLVSLREKPGASPHLGLGLYIVRLVAVAHGGAVAARNLPGGAGVEFEVYFPPGTPGA
ncbi:ATP-binding protein [Elongatibacter sediminis]|uniref:histidine kinase n=1 Tax=Elongatibacter sediminis TaxID=3119006 RepID=A0AAW9RBD2_9GAMM